MSEGKNQLKCAVCKAYLFEDDDTVYCPECGAPHHRDCYSSLGHCGLEALHGTDQSYDKVAARVQDTETTPKHNPVEESARAGEVKCGMCGEIYDIEEHRCPKCGTPNIAKMGAAAQFDYLGGIPADMDLGDGVTADEAKRFVMSNTQRYIPKFAAFKAGVRSSWNWFAFLFPCSWYLSRKMYKNGIIFGLLSIAFTLLTVPFSKALYYIDLSGAASYAQIGEIVYENIPQIGIAVLISAFIGSLLGIILRFVAAVTGDYSYKKFTVDTVKQLKAESMDIDEDYRRRGGVSLVGMMVGFFAVQYLPSIIASFF